MLLRNLFEFKGLAENTSSFAGNPPLVSICIPARNEEAVINRSVASALLQTYPNVEVLVLNDNSTDQTGEILETLSQTHSRLKILHGEPKPDDWLGKPWACHQLSKVANGELLVFMDADVWLEPEVIAKAVSGTCNVDALTVWPQQKLGSFWEKLVVPNIYFSLLTLLPSVYVERAPRWMPRFLGRFLNTKFVAACGQFFVFKREAYERINGHFGVKQHVVEDMGLARNLKNSGFTLRMMHGIDTVYCRMYTSGSETWKGFEKNFMAGFGNVFEFIFMGILHFLVFLLPLISLLIGIQTNDSQLVLFSLIAVALIVIQRFILSVWFKWNPVFSVLHFASVTWYQLLALKSLYNRIFGIKATWKGRKV
ncbi:MAG: glycosyltransferase [Balneolales bacterium]|nr:glycosyltransferase [Balneolales bacterium]